MTSVRQLGYIGLEVSDLGAWEPFATNLLGLQVGHRDEDGSLALRMDDYQQRLVLHPGPADDLAYLGFEAAGESELEGLRASLTREGLAVSESKPETAAERRVARLLHVTDPSGIPIELYYGAAIAHEPFQSSAATSGFVTGDEGLGHVVICAKDAAASEHFYVDLLGLRLSDRVRVPIGEGRMIEITFLHANRRHHSVGFMSVPIPKRLHHFMIEAQSEDDVGRAR